MQITRSWFTSGWSFGGRLGREDVERRAAHAPALQRLEQRRLVDDAAARGVHHQHPRAHLREGGAAEHAGGVLGARHVDGDGVGALEQRVEGDQLDVEIGDLLLGQIGVVRDHLHAEPARAIGHDAADVAEADHAERAVEELHAHELVLLPVARLHRGRGLRDVARERDQQRDGVLGGRDVVAARRVHHDDAARGRGGDVDVVDADPGAPDHAQLAARGDHVGGHLGAAADHEPVGVGDRRRADRRAGDPADSRPRCRARARGSRAPGWRANPIREPWPRLASPLRGGAAACPPKRGARAPLWPDRRERRPRQRSSGSPARDPAPLGPRLRP